MSDVADKIEAWEARYRDPQRVSNAGLLLDAAALLPEARDRIRELTEALAATADELDRWGWGDMHYGDQGQERRVVEAVARARSVLGEGDTSRASVSGEDN